VIFKVVYTKIVEDYEGCGDVVKDLLKPDNLAYYNKIEIIPIEQGNEITREIK
jgi:hypothetical protein